MNRSSKKSSYAPWKKKNPGGGGWLKAIAITLGLFFVGAVGIILFLDRDTLKESIAKTLSEKTGTQVEIQFLDLGYSHGLGLEAGGLTVRTGDGGRQVLWAESLFLEVRILPLLSGEVVIESATIVKPRIKVYLDSGDAPKKEFKKASLSSAKKKTDDGNSWAKIITPESRLRAEPPPPQNTPSPLVDRRIIDEFRNRLKAFHITAKNIHVEQGTIQFIRRGGKDTREREPLGFSFDLKIRRPSDEMIDVILEDVHLNLGPLFLLGRVEADDVLSETSRLEVQLRTQPFSVLELVKSLQPPTEEESGASANPEISVRIEQLTLLASCPLNSLADKAAFRRDLKAETRFVTGDTHIPIGDYELAVSQVKGKARWEEGFIVYEIRGEALNGKVLIGGQQPFPLEAAEDSSPMLETEVQLTALDVSRLTVPEGWAPLQGQVSGVLKVTLARNLEGPPKVTGSLLGENLVLGTHDFKLAARNTEVRLQSPPGQPVSFNLTSHRAVLDQVRFRKIVAKVSISPGRVVLEKSTWSPSHGTLTAHGTYDTRSRKYHLEFLGKDLWAGDYTKNQIQGIMRAYGSVNGTVPRKLPGMRGLFGTVSVKVSAVKFDPSGEIKTLLSAIDPAFFRRQNLRGLQFDYLGGNFKIHNGKFKTGNLVLKGESMDVYLEGIYDGYTRTLNMMGKALPKVIVDRARSSPPQTAQLLSKAQARRGLTETHFKLEGPASRPHMRLLGIIPRKK